MFVKSFWRLWRDFGGSPPTMNLPDSIEPVIAAGGALWSVRRRRCARLAEQIAATGVTYFEGSFVFGDMTYDEAHALHRKFRLTKSCLRWPMPMRKPGC